MPELLDLTRDLPVSGDLLTALVPVLVGLVTTARHYRRTGRLPLARLPLRAIRSFAYTARAEWFKNGRPPTTAATGLALASFRSALAANGYEPKWPLSFHYYGEDANLRAYYYDPTREYPHRQIHVRGFDAGDGDVAEYAHDEPSALAHPVAHIRSEDMDDVTAEVAAALDAAVRGDETALDPRNIVRNE